MLSNHKASTTRSLSKFNPVFQFNYGNKTMLVTSVVGHIMEEDFYGPAKNWNGFPIKELFSAPVTKTVKASLMDVKANIESLMKRADTLVLWLDCDREGENIGFEVLQVAQGVKSRFTTKRAHFSALTERDIRRAMETLRDPDSRLSEAVEARQETDLRIGAAFTRFQTLRLRERLPEVSGVISFGPCQFPTLGFVVRREWERLAFTPEHFFSLHLHHTNCHFYCTRGDIFDQVAATLVYEDMLLRAAAQQPVPRLATVVNVQQRQNRRRPPFPLSTVSMQKLAATHLHISSEQCMKLAESLYQEGVLSYPRTETDYFTFTDAELHDLVSTQTGNAAVANFAQRIVNNPAEYYRRPLNGGHGDQAHPPIHPTGVFHGDAESDKFQLFMLVVRHFLACMSPDAVDAQTTVTVLYGGEYFNTSGAAEVEKGWTEIFAYARRENSRIPNYQLHETFVPKSVVMEKSVTQPPPRLTETALISLMDSNGIGTDATIAQHIKTLIDRSYVQRVGQSMVPTSLGLALAAAYEGLGLVSLLLPQLRAQTEAAMGDIATGAATRGDVVKASLAFYRGVFERLSARGDEFVRLVQHFFHGGGVSASSPLQLLDDEGTAAAYITDVQVLQQTFSVCGRCKGPLRLVEVPNDPAAQRFLQCERCREQYRLPSAKFTDIRVLSPTTLCPLCGFTVLQAESRERQTSHTFCPHCYNNPPPSDLSSDIENSGSFRCFQCLHPSCALAKGKEQIMIARCILCEVNELRLRVSRGGAFLSCAGYPACTLKIGLPKATSVVPVPHQRCENCNAVMLTFDFRGVQPVPGLEEVDTICVNCDIRVKDYLVLQRGPASSSATAPPPSAASSSSYVLPSIRGIAMGGGPASAAGVVKCECGLPAKQLVSRKEASFGKAFRTCANRTCGFFQWCE